METKSAPLVEIKTNSTPGEFTAVFSAIGNIDRQGDRVMPHAFEKAMSDDPVPPCYWAHKHEIPPIGEGLDWKVVGNDVVYDARLFVKGDVEHQFANMVYAGMKSYDGRIPAIRQFSYTYGLAEGGAERVFEDGKAIRNLLEIRPVAEIGPCFMGANPETGLVSAAKSLDIPALVATHGEKIFEVDFFQLGAKDDWDDAFVDSLPDASFLFIEPGGKRDDFGRTERPKRHFPFKTAEGQISMKHLRDAIENGSTLSGKAGDIVKERAQRLLRAQEGKAMLLSTIFSSKAWGDIDGYSISQLLNMLDSAVTYIQFEDDVADVTAMQGIAQQLVNLLQTDLDEVTGNVADRTAIDDAIDGVVGTEVEVDVYIYESASIAAGAATKLYESAANLVTLPVKEAAAETAEITPAAGESKSEEGVDDNESEGEKSLLSDPALTVKDSNLARLLHR